MTLREEFIDSMKIQLKKFADRWDPRSNPRATVCTDLKFYVQGYNYGIKVASSFDKTYWLKWQPVENLVSTLFVRALTRFDALSTDRQLTLLSTLSTAPMSRRGSFTVKEGLNHQLTLDFKMDSLTGIYIEAPMNFIETLIVQSTRLPSNTLSTEIKKLYSNTGILGMSLDKAPPSFYSHTYSWNEVRVKFRYSSHQITLNEDVATIYAGRVGDTNSLVGTVNDLLLPAETSKILYDICKTIGGLQ